MSTDQTLARIDATLEDYDQWDGNSPDAARWDGDDWIDERKPDAQTFVTAIADELRHYRQRHMIGSHYLVHDDGRVMRFEPRDPELQPYLDAQRDTMERMAVACGFTPTEWQRVVLNSWLLPSVPLTYFPPERPMAAAERTSSPQRRAGSRRTKRQARRRG